MGPSLSQAKSAITRFITEAGQAAKNECGFAGMLTIFPVILGVEEAVSQQRGNANLFVSFVKRMKQPFSWLHGKNAPSSPEQVGQFLSEIRNGLAHQFALPVGVCLVNTKRMRSFGVRNTQTIRISAPVILSMRRL